MPATRLRRLDHEVKMIRHEDIGVNLPARLGASLSQRLDEELAIRVIHEDQLTPVTAIHAVINCAELLDSQLAGHDKRVICAASCVHYQEPTRASRFAAKSPNVPTPASREV